MKRRLTAVFLAFAMAAGLTACGSKSTAETQPAGSAPAAQTEQAADAETTATPEGMKEIELGTSGSYMMIPEAYDMGEINAEDTDDNQVAYYKSDDSEVDFDIYQWAKASGETLEEYAAQEAAMYQVEEQGTVEYNGATLAYYYATEEYEGQEMNTATYIAEVGDNFVEIVFWLDGENAQEQVEAMISTFAIGEDKAVKGVLPLGTSTLTLTPEQTFVKGDISELDTDDNQVAYYSSADVGVDFDVYQWAKADGETLDSIAEAEAAEYGAEAEEAEFNGIRFMVYTAVEEYEGQEYTTWTYLTEDGSDIVELVFWLDGENAESVAEQIMMSVSR